MQPNWHDRMNRPQWLMPGPEFSREWGKPSKGKKELYVPLSVMHGGRRKKLGWWLKGRKQALALRLAPWLTPVRSPEHQTYIHLTGGPKDRQQFACKGVGRYLHWPSGSGVEGGRYVLSSSAYEHHLGYAWQENDPDGI